MIAGQRGRIVTMLISCATRVVPRVRFAFALLPLALFLGAACGSPGEPTGSPSLNATNPATEEPTAASTPSEVDLINRKLAANNEPTVDAAEYATYVAISRTPLPTTTADPDYIPPPADCGPSAARTDIPARFGQIRTNCQLVGTQ